MKIKTIVNSLLFVAFSQVAFSQISFRTGDPQLEKELNTLNTDAKKNIERFKENVSVYYGIKKDRTQELLNKKMEPAEIEFAGRLSKVSGVNFDKVIQLRESNKDKGWGELAKDLGIKPGSAEFHALKGKPKKNENQSKGKSDSKSGKKTENSKGSKSESKGKGKN